ncbi:uncharacterized protein LOC100192613 [Zea mays]|uniref:Uncharacterized protein n=1 Tax=Zea mays TaxID=4577 RepID=B4FC00_MAIZE|nr:uncharacterized protein LOC100192613 [Zea mays]ACF79643.1 unknown [Zea mays]|eukprot:NP_001131300.1 uncharacterized protein LOC100192613 [Zea mays]
MPSAHPCSFHTPSSCSQCPSARSLSVRCVQLRSRLLQLAAPMAELAPVRAFSCVQPWRVKLSARRLLLPASASPASCSRSSLLLSSGVLLAGLQSPMVRSCSAPSSLAPVARPGRLPAALAQVAAIEPSNPAHPSPAVVLWSVCWSVSWSLVWSARR